jgi:hypothetical protein
VSEDSIQTVLNKLRALDDKVDKLKGEIPEGALDLIEGQMSKDVVFLADVVKYVGGRREEGGRGREIPEGAL